MQEADDRQQAPDDDRAPSSAAWALRFRRGEPDAVREVGRRVAGILTHGALAIPDDERDDLAQEVMTELWQAVNRTRFDVTAGFWGFVEVVTSRRSIDWLRRRRERIPLAEPLPDRGSGPLGRVLEHERGDLAADVLAALDPPCRELITLRLRDGASYREIARRLERSEGSLRVKLYRCIRRARGILRRRTEGTKERTRT